MKYLLYITLFIVACKQTPRENVYYKDFGYGEQDFPLDSPSREYIQSMFSYENLSKTTLETLDFPDSTVFEETPNGVNIKGKYYTLNDLYPEGKDEPDGLYLSSRYWFKFGGKDYILFYVTYQPPNSHVSPTQGILVDLADPAKLMPFPALQFSPTFLCINDFDHDGILDYAHWDLGMECISCYHLVNGQYEKDERHYIAVASSMYLYSVKNEENSYWYE